MVQRAARGVGPFSVRFRKAGGRGQGHPVVDRYIHWRLDSRAGLRTVEDHGGPDSLAPVIARAVHEMAMKDQQITGLNQHGSGLGHVVVDDFDVAEVGTRPSIRDVFVDRFPMGSGEHP